MNYHIKAIIAGLLVLLIGFGEAFALGYISSILPKSSPIVKYFVMIVLLAVSLMVFLSLTHRILRIFFGKKEIK